MFDLFKRRKGRGARRRATPSMFAEFLEYFGEARSLFEDGAADPYDAFIDGLGGRSFGDGVFRVFERSDLEEMASGGVRMLHESSAVSLI